MRVSGNSTACCPPFRTAPLTFRLPHPARTVTATFCEMNRLWYASVRVELNIGCMEKSEGVDDGDGVVNNWNPH